MFHLNSPFDIMVIINATTIDMKKIAITKKSNDEMLLNGFIKSTALYRFSMSIYLSDISNKIVDVIAKDTRKSSGNRISLFKIQPPCVIYQNVCYRF